MVSVLAALGLFLAACALYKPLRVLTPETFGLTCMSDDICVEDPATITEAIALGDNALRFVEENVGPLRQPPRVLFCGSEECFARFENPKVAALYFWGLDTLLINDKGWQDYVLRHELIHHWQVENFGAVRSSKFPRWYIEGMAHSLSRDPRTRCHEQISRDGARSSMHGWKRVMIGGNHLNSRKQRGL